MIPAAKQSLIEKVKGNVEGNIIEVTLEELPYAIEVALSDPTARKLGYSHFRGNAEVKVKYCMQVKDIPTSTDLTDYIQQQHVYKLSNGNFEVKWYDKEGKNILL